jgi:hypothetical protein
MCICSFAPSVVVSIASASLYERRPDRCSSSRTSSRCSTSRPRWRCGIPTVGSASWKSAIRRHLLDRRHRRPNVLNGVCRREVRHRGVDGVAYARNRRLRKILGGRSNWTTRASILFRDYHGVSLPVLRVVLRAPASLSWSQSRRSRLRRAVAKCKDRAIKRRPR